MYLFILALSWFLLVSCQSQAPAIQTKDKVFMRGRRFTYSVAQFTSNGHLIRLDTIVIRSYGDYKHGEYDTITTQIKIGYSYGAESKPKVYTGVIENNFELWSHPPRRNEYGILELSPFPYVKLPVYIGSQWKWKLSVGSHYGNTQWATWRGVMPIAYNYRVSAKRLVDSKLGQLECWVVQAQATCQQGVSSLETLYHPKYGFVQLNYHNINGSRMNLALIEMDLELDSKIPQKQQYPFSQSISQ